VVQVGGEKGFVMLLRVAAFMLCFGGFGVQGVGFFLLGDGFWNWFGVQQWRFL
jgi:hypothetical protein